MIYNSGKWGISGLTPPLSDWVHEEKDSLEKLCRDMYKLLKLSRDTPATVSGTKLIDARMRELGLLEK